MEEQDLQCTFIQCESVLQNHSLFFSVNCRAFEFVGRFLTYIANGDEPTAAAGKLQPSHFPGVEELVRFPYISHLKDMKVLFISTSAQIPRSAWHRIIADRALA